MAANLRMPIGIPRERGEPGRVPAFVLAVGIHTAFAVFLVFGVSWQTKAPPPLVAELWEALPAIKAVEPAPEPTPRVEPEPPPMPKVEVKPPPEPPGPSKADIELKDKLEKEKKQKLEREKREQDEQKTKRAAEEKKKLEDEKKRKEEDKRKADEKAKKVAADKARADADALKARTQAQQRVVDEWSARIRGLVLSKANVPDSVTGQPEVQIRLKLLVNGAVFEGVVSKRSGNPVYDDAIERAIRSIREWPTPSDADVFRNYREVTLNIKHDK